MIGSRKCRHESVQDVGRAHRGDGLTPCGRFQVKDVNVIIPASSWTVPLWQQSNTLRNSPNTGDNIFTRAR